MVEYTPLWFGRERNFKTGLCKVAREKTKNLYTIMAEAKKYSIDTKNWPRRVAKVLMQFDTIDATMVEIDPQDLEELGTDKIVLKLSERSGYPMLSVQMDLDGVNRRVMFLGPTAEELVNEIPFELNDRGHLVGYMSYSSGKFEHAPNVSGEPKETEAEKEARELAEFKASKAK